MSDEYDDDEQSAKQNTPQYSSSQGPQQQGDPKEESTAWTRATGFAKAVFGSAGFKTYVALSVATGGWFAGGIAIAGAAATIIGFGAKHLGHALGLKTMERRGAKLENYGLKFLAAPALIVGWAIDGVTSLFTGKEPNPGCVGHIHNLTRKISGIDAIEGKEGNQEEQNKALHPANAQKEKEQEQELERQKQKEKALASSPASPSRSMDPAGRRKLEESSAPPFQPTYQAPHQREETSQQSSLESSSAKKEPVIDIVEKLKASGTLEIAQQTYNEHTKEADRFIMVDEPSISPDGKTTTIKWRPQNSKGDESELVTLIYDQDRNVIKSEPGKKASAIIPPVKHADGYSVVSYKDGVEQKETVNTRGRTAQPSIKSASLGNLSPSSVPNLRQSSSATISKIE